MKKNPVKSRQTFAKKSFGQNFLVDRNYIGKIISALAMQSGETIFEIGAGRGALTEKLLEAGANVVAVELERVMIGVLKEKFSDRQNFHLIESDALKVDFRTLSKSFAGSRKVKLVANLPYYISTAILQKLIDEREAFSALVLMFQREVVERITAPAGSAERGYLSVIVEAHAQVKKLFDVPPNAFFPAPKVWSSVVEITFSENASDNESVGDNADFQTQNVLEVERNNFDETLFRVLVSKGFEKKRKTIFNNLREFAFQESIFDAAQMMEVLKSAGIEAQRRAESLTLNEWKELASRISSLVKK